MEDRFKEQLGERTISLSDTAPLNAPRERSTDELAAPAERTVIGGPEPTQMGVAVLCPVCETQNAPGEIWCAECGFRLDATPGAADAPDLTGVPALLTDLKGNAYPLEEGKNTIGRQNTSILLEHASVSRRHAQIVIEGRQIWVEDLGSSNGTYVDGARLHPHDRRELQSGMEVRFGGHALTIRTNLSEAQEPTIASSVAVPNVAASNVTQTLSAEELPTSSGPGAARREDLEADAPRLLLPSGQAFFLREGVNKVGRRDVNDIVLPDAFTSGHHADVIREGMAVMVVDQNSTNGTLVNAARVLAGRRTLLENGDHITFGKTALKFVWPQKLVSEVSSLDAGEGSP